MSASRPEIVDVYMPEDPATSDPPTIEPPSLPFSIDVALTKLPLGTENVTVAVVLDTFVELFAGEDSTTCGMGKVPGVQCGVGEAVTTGTL